MKRATLIADTNSSEKERLEAWLFKWRKQLPVCSENQGCGCCADIYDVEAPEKALREVAELQANSPWSHSEKPKVRRKRDLKKKR